MEKEQSEVEEMRGYGLCPQATLQKHTTSRFAELRTKYRSSFEIIGSILEITKGNGACQYTIVTRASITHMQFKKYLESLAKTGFIETGIEKGQITYRASRKGLDFLNQYHILLEMLSNSRTLDSTTTITYEIDKAEMHNQTATSSTTRWMR
jgi:predicted transcriptional regulator